MTTITIIDGITGEQITRPMTDDEQTELKTRNAARLKEQKTIEINILKGIENGSNIKILDNQGKVVFKSSSITDEKIC